MLPQSTTDTHTGHAIRLHSKAGTELRMHENTPGAAFNEQLIGLIWLKKKGSYLPQCPEAVSPSRRRSANSLTANVLQRLLLTPRSADWSLQLKPQRGPGMSALPLTITFSQPLTLPGAALYCLRTPPADTPTTPNCPIRVQSGGALR